MTLKILYWFARILAILAIFFMMMFSLDVFEGQEAPVRKLLGFLIHNIPAFLFILALITAWKYEIAGGILLILLFIAAGIFFKSFTGNTGSLIIISPFVISGIIFILHHILSLRNKVTSET